MKCSDYRFNLGFDEDLGYYAVIAGTQDEFDPKVDRIIPVGFSRVAWQENIYLFDLDPHNARNTLKECGFVEDLDLI